MSEAVIVDAIRTPIGRAVQGVIEGRPRRRAGGAAAQDARRAQPEGRLRRDRRRHDGRGVGRQRAGLQRRPQRHAARGIDYHVPACTVNRFCASSLQTIRMAFHAITADEGDQYIAAGVEVGLALRQRPVGGRAQPEARRLGGLAVRRLHPDGDDGRERRRQVRRLARGAGRVGGAVAVPRRRGA